MRAIGRNGVLFEMEIPRFCPVGRRGIGGLMGIFQEMTQRLLDLLEVEIVLKRTRQSCNRTEFKEPRTNPGIEFTPASSNPIPEERYLGASVTCRGSEIFEVSSENDINNCPINEPRNVHNTLIPILQHATLNLLIIHYSNNNLSPLFPLPPLLLLPPLLPFVIALFPFTPRPIPLRLRYRDLKPLKHLRCISRHPPITPTNSVRPQTRHKNKQNLLRKSQSCHHPHHQPVLRRRPGGLLLILCDGGYWCGRDVSYALWDWEILHCDGSSESSRQAF